jgi:tetratricopeptide (TPR) repeat protein
MFAGVRRSRYANGPTSARSRYDCNKKDRHYRFYPSKNHVFVFSSLLLLASIGSIAQVPADGGSWHMYGSIVNGKGQPVPFATVELRDVHGTKIATGVSDAAGKFVFVPMGKVGDYVLLAANEVCVTEEQVTLDATVREFNFTLPDPSGSFTFTHRETDTVSARQLGVPKEARRYLKLANQEFSRSNLENAEADVDQALKVDSSFAAAFSMRAFLRLASRALAGAIEDAQHAVALDPSEGDAYLALGTAYNSLGEFPRAEEALGNSLGLRPDLWQAELEMAKAYYGQGRFVAALYELDKLHNDFPDVHLVRANVLERLGRSREAAAEFSQFLRQEPDDPRSEQVRRIVAGTDPASSSSSFLHP